MSVEPTTTDLPELRRLQRAALSVGLVTLSVCVLAAIAGSTLELSADESFLYWLFKPGQFYRSYLLAYLGWLAIGLGSLGILMVQHLTGGRWGWVIRRSLEAATRTLPVLAILFLPVFLGLADVYPWATWPEEEIQGSEVLSRKQHYLNVPFFIFRTVLYFAIWIAFATYLSKLSWAEETSNNHAVSRTMRQVSAPGLLCYGLAITFASIDWVMSLEPLWYSTIYGVLFATGQVLTALSFCVLILGLLAYHSTFQDVIEGKDLRDLASLLLAFVMIWAYLAFSQYLLIWSGNLPEETTWYVKRLRGGWEFVGLAMVLFHFLLPFGLLLAREVKQRATTLATVAGLVLCMRFVDMYWMIVPAYFPYESIQFHWMDVALVIGVGGIWVAMFLRELRRRPLLAPRDEQSVEEVQHG